MKKILLILLFSLASLGYSQSTELINDLEEQLQTMGKDLAAPAASSATIGLNWSDAHIGNFPHFGVGVFTGAALIPIDGFDELLSVLDTSESGVELPSELKQIPLGLPLPAIGVDGRIGGFGLPFDIGIKYAGIDLSMDKASIEYSLIGMDVRFALLEDSIALPTVSLGIGYSRLVTNVGLKGILGQDITLLDGSGKLYDSLLLSDPDVEFGWTSNVIEAKAQISKSLLMLTPYFGVNFSYGITEIGGGVKTSVKNQNGETLTQEQIDDAIYLANNGGLNIPSINTSGFEVTNDETAMGLKLTLGTSINIFVVRVDVSANYDVLADVYGGQLGFRVQL